jgi:hypothetical protein
MICHRTYVAPTALYSPSAFEVVVQSVPPKSCIGSQCPLWIPMQEGVMGAPAGAMGHCHDNPMHPPWPDAGLYPSPEPERTLSTSSVRPGKERYP